MEKEGETSPVTNDSKTRSCKSGEIPFPVSATAIRQYSFSSIVFSFTERVIFPPAPVYLNAFDNKLRTADDTFSTSTHKRMPLSGKSTVYSIFPDTAIGRKVSAISCNNAMILISERQSFIMPASIFCTFRKSFTKR